MQTCLINTVLVWQHSLSARTSDKNVTSHGDVTHTSRTWVGSTRRGRARLETREHEAATSHRTTAARRPLRAA
jgi:hypothetical protein